MGSSKMLSSNIIVDINIVDNNNSSERRKIKKITQGCARFPVGGCNILGFNPHKL
jgi:hypothetical protein